VKLVRPHLHFDADGILSPRYTLSFHNVGACCYYALALLVSRDSNLARRVGRCQRDGCGKFFFHEPEGAGRLRRFCSDEHKNQQGVSNYHKRWGVPRRASARSAR
jgi:hypothetical protein